MSASVSSMKNKVITVASAGTPVAMFATANASRVIWVNFCAPAVNTGSMYVGPTGSVSATTAMQIIKGTNISITAPAGTLLNLDNLKVDAGTNGDTLIVSWLEISNG